MDLKLDDTDAKNIELDATRHYSASQRHVCICKPEVTPSRVLEGDYVH
jgi:hypothetical protein